MKTRSSKRIFCLLSFMIILVLVLSACKNSNSANPASSTGAPVAASPDCPYGKWKITNFTSYMQSVAANINSKSGGGTTVTDLGATGTAILTFNEDGTGSFIADNFVDKFTMSMAVGGSTVDIPVTLTQNGTSTAHYKVESDQITFLDQDPGNLIITMDINGSTSNLDTSVFGKPGETQLYQFACGDTNTLSLKVIAVSNMDLAPLELTRVP